MLLVLALYALHLITRYPPVADVDLASVALEGALALTAVAGLFTLTGLRRADHPAYPTLFSGMALMSWAFTSDMLDEFVDEPAWATIVVEGGFQVLGLALLLYGLSIWIRQTRQLQRRLEKLAITDELTQVSNRRQLMQLLERELALCARNPDHVLTAVMFDVDHFKRVNDEHGHAEGDRALVDVAAVTQTVLRSTDLLARMGGEEFIVLSPTTPLDGAVQLAERLRVAVAQVTVGDGDALSASFGVARYRAGESAPEFIKRLDTAMYAAKKAGRDRVVVADGLPEATMASAASPPPTTAHE